MDTPVTIETPRKTRGDATQLREYEADLDQWLCVDEITLAAAARKLEETHGVRVSTKVLWRWLRKHNAQKLRQTILRNITSGAAAVRQLRDHATRHEVPQLDELMSLVRVLAANLATRPDATIRAESIVALIRPIIEHAKLAQAGARIAIDQAKLELLQRAAERDAAAQRTISDETLTPEQKMAAFKDIFGIVT